MEMQTNPTSSRYHQVTPKVREFDDWTIWRAERTVMFLRDMNLFSDCIKIRLFYYLTVFLQLGF